LTVSFVARDNKIRLPRRQNSVTEPRPQGSGSNAGVTQLVECNLAKVDVAGSNPVSRSILNLELMLVNARILVWRLAVLSFLLFVILFILCWPLALMALILYPVVWLLLLPFRLIGIAVGGVLELVWALITLPARLIRRIA
jgi:hypothetical protein